MDTDIDPSLAATAYRQQDAGAETENLVSQPPAAEGTVRAVKPTRRTPASMREVYVPRHRRSGADNGKKSATADLLDEHKEANNGGGKQGRERTSKQGGDETKLPTNSRSSSSRDKVRKKEDKGTSGRQRPSSASKKERPGENRKTISSIKVIDPRVSDGLEVIQRSNSSEGSSRKKSEAKHKIRRKPKEEESVPKQEENLTLTKQEDTREAGANNEEEKEELSSASQSLHVDQTDPAETYDTNVVTLTAEQVEGEAAPPANATPPEVSGHDEDETENDEGPKDQTPGKVGNDLKSTSRTIRRTGSYVPPHRRGESPRDSNELNAVDESESSLKSAEHVAELGMSEEQRESSIGTEPTAAIAPLSEGEQNSVKTAFEEEILQDEELEKVVPTDDSDRLVEREIGDESQAMDESQKVKREEDGEAEKEPSPSSSLPPKPKLNRLSGVVGGSYVPPYRRNRPREPAAVSTAFSSERSDEREKVEDVMLQSLDDEIVPEQKTDNKGTPTQRQVYSPYIPRHRREGHSNGSPHDDVASGGRMRWKDDSLFKGDRWSSNDSQRPRRRASSDVDEEEDSDSVVNIRRFIMEAKREIGNEAPCSVGLIAILTIIKAEEKQSYERLASAARDHGSYLLNSKNRRSPTIVVRSKHGIDLSGIDEFCDPVTDDHILEITGFPQALRQFQLDMLLEPYRKAGSEIRWVESGEVALAVFRSPLKMKRNEFLKVRSLDEATEASKSLVKNGVSAPQRAATDVSTASRLISRSLGIRTPMPRVRPSRRTKEEKAKINDSWD